MLLFVQMQDPPFLNMLYFCVCVCCLLHATSTWKLLTMQGTCLFTSRPLAQVCFCSCFSSYLWTTFLMTLWKYWFNSFSSSEPPKSRLFVWFPKDLYNRRKQLKYQFSTLSQPWGHANCRHKELGMGNSFCLFGWPPIIPDFRWPAQAQNYEYSCEYSWQKFIIESKYSENHSLHFIK